MKFNANIIVLFASMMVPFLCSALPATESAESFDVSPILEHNRDWLHPDLKQLKSVAFKHAMEPIRYDERFFCRRDGASLVELIDSEYDKDKVGQQWVTTPDQQSFYFASQSKYAVSKPLPEGGLDRYIRFHTMGTRCNFVTLDWGWDQKAFAVRKASRQPDDQLLLIVEPLNTGYCLSAGAMFHGSSSAYVHDLNVGRAELTIDPKSNRILKEVDYSSEGKVQCEIEFFSWHSTSKGREVPLRIHLHFARHGHFAVDYRFQWPADELWILENSTAQFEDKPPQHERISELVINQPIPILEAALAQIDSGEKALQAKSVKPTQITLTGVHPFELGKSAVLPKSDAQQLPPVQSVHFTLRPRERFFEMGGIPDLIAEIGLSPDTNVPGPDECLLLTLLDVSGNPLRAVHTPLAALSVCNRRFNNVVQAVHEHNTLWLAPNIQKYPNLTYDFVCENHHQVTVTKTSDSYLRRGVTLSLDWDAFVAYSEQYKAPVQFDAVLNGKKVIVAAVSGPPFGLRWGHGLNGVTGYYGGYSVTTASNGLVVIEKETWRPLVSRYGDTEIHFLDYIEVKPGMHAPLRIVVFNGESSYDFHFQVVDSRVWLFDRACRKDKAWARAEFQSFDDGSPAKITARLPDDSLPVEKLKPLDWSQIIQRVSVHQPELALVEKIIAREKPWEHPDCESLLTVGKNTDEPLLVVDFGRSWLFSDVRNWTLTWLSPDQPPRSLPGSRTFKVPTYPFRSDEAMTVHVAGSALGKMQGEGRASIRSYALKPEAGNVCATLEILSETRNRGLWMPMAMALLDQNGTLVSADSADLKMIVREGIVSREQKMVLPLINAHPQFVLFGFKSAVTSQPMGSTWGSLMVTDPPYSYELLLSADDVNVWQYGITLLESELDEQFQRVDMRGFESNAKDPILSLLEPHRDSFIRLLKYIDQPDALARLARLVGYTHDKRFHDTLKELLDHPHQKVKDAAAIGLGLLGDAQGIDRLRSILARPVPDTEDNYVRWEEENWKQHATRALARISTKE